jgi:tRNA(fMet)-specific endonuclease VapC
MVDTFLEQMNVSIIPFRKEEALVAALGAIRRWDFKDNARDYPIGATAVKLNGILITNNTKDFKWLKNVITPDEMLKKNSRSRKH